MTVWNDITVSVLTKLIASGKSQREVAEIMGLTHGMVIGKLWRLKIKSTIPKSEKRAKPPKSTLPAMVKRAEKVKRETRLLRRARKLPGRLCFNMGLTHD